MDGSIRRHSRAPGFAQRALADQIDEPRHAARQAKEHIDGARRKRDAGAARNRQAVIHLPRSLRGRTTGSADA
jgi:hypothetical protein